MVRGLSLLTKQQTPHPLGTAATYTAALAPEAKQRGQTCIQA